ncbi:MAG: hypothetical protein R3338_11265 [Thermoanaerobaculia bacterium]|nr:hypothetical protein [Thermoanaerobaculia bacterium]
MTDDKASKPIRDHEKDDESQGAENEDRSPGQERTATEKERRVAEDVTEAPRQ